MPAPVAQDTCHAYYWNDQHASAWIYKTARHRGVNSTSVSYVHYMFGHGGQTLTGSSNEKAQLFETRATALPHAM